jgi:hypothetical protein
MQRLVPCQREGRSAKGMRGKARGGKGGIKGKRGVAVALGTAQRTCTPCTVLSVLLLPKACLCCQRAEPWGEFLGCAVAFRFGLRMAHASAGAHGDGGDRLPFPDTTRPLHPPPVCALCDP